MFRRFLPLSFILALLFSCGEQEKIDLQVAVSSVALDNTSLTLIEGESFTLTATVSPANATRQDVRWSSSDDKVAEVSLTGQVTAIKEGMAVIKVTTLDGGITAQCEVTVINDTRMEAVDLGLNVKWASANLGASSPEDYGDYYAWGETETKENYSWETYKWCNGSNYSITKYNIGLYGTDDFSPNIYGAVDNIKRLETADDVAHVKLGGKWRMPTDIEVLELIMTQDNANYQWEWKSLNGHNGWLVVYLVNNHSIFLPAAGSQSDNENHLPDVGTNGRYWSSSVYLDNPDCAYFLNFDSLYVGAWRHSRCSGYSVRPVYAE